MPQYTCWVLEDTDKRCDLYLVVFNRRTLLAVGNIGIVQFTKIGKAGETPVAFFGDKTVVSVCYGSALLRIARSDLRLQVWIVGSHGLEIARQNWAHACHPSGAVFGLA